MKFSKKSILALGVALGVICSVSGAAFALTSLSGTLSGYKYSASCSITNGDARAYTYYAGSGAASVVATYTMVERSTNIIKKVTRTSGSYGSASIIFDAPLNYRSRSITCTHTVTAADCTWKGKTSAYFG